MTGGAAAGKEDWGIGFGVGCFFGRCGDWGPFDKRFDLRSGFSTQGIQLGYSLAEIWIYLWQYIN